MGRMELGLSPNGSFPASHFLKELPMEKTLPYTTERPGAAPVGFGRESEHPALMTLEDNYHGREFRRGPLSDEEFTRKLYAEGSLSREDLDRAGGARVASPLSDGEFARRMAAEDAKGQAAITNQPYPVDDRLQQSQGEAQPPEVKDSQQWSGREYSLEDSERRFARLFTEGEAGKYPPDAPVLRQGTVNDLGGKGYFQHKDNYTVPEVLENIPKNIGPSAKKFAGDLVDAVSDPDKTLESIKNIAKGFAGSPEHRPYRDAVLGKVTERYGDWESIKRTVAEDPVNFLGDISMGGTGVGITARTGSLVAKAAGKAQGLSKQALSKGKAVSPGYFEKGAVTLSEKLGDASKYFHDVAGTVDPIAAPMSALSKVLQKAIQETFPTASKVTEQIAKSTTHLSRASSVTQAVSTGHSIVQEDLKKQKKGAR